MSAQGSLGPEIRLFKAENSVLIRALESIAPESPSILGVYRAQVLLDHPAGSPAYRHRPLLEFLLLGRRSHALPFSFQQFAEAPLHAGPPPCSSPAPPWNSLRHTLIFLRIFFKASVALLLVPIRLSLYVQEMARGLVSHSLLLPFNAVTFTYRTNYRAGAMLVQMSQSLGVLGPRL